MEALTSSFVAESVPFNEDPCACLQRSTGPKTVKVACARCYACFDEDTVLVREEKVVRERNAVIEMVRDGVGRYNSSWMAPPFDLPAEASWSCTPEGSENASLPSVVASLMCIQEDATLTHEDGRILIKEGDDATATVNATDGSQLEAISTRSSYGTNAGEEDEPKRWRFAKFTAEKARMLRREMRASETWHDLMYHSAIATRLASADN